MTKLHGQGQSLVLDSKIISKTDDYLKKMIDGLGIIGLNYAILIDNEMVHQKTFVLSLAQLQVGMRLNKCW